MSPPKTGNPTHLHTVRRGNPPQFRLQSTPKRNLGYSAIRHRQAPAGFNSHPGGNWVNQGGIPFHKIRSFNSHPGENWVWQTIGPKNNKSFNSHPGENWVSATVIPFCARMFQFTPRRELGEPPEAAAAVHYVSIHTQARTGWP